MKALINRDKKKRINLPFFEEKEKVLKSLKHNRKLGLIWWSRHKLGKFPGKRIKTRCILTGRGKALNKTFKLSRLELRRWVQINMLPGVRKSSW